MGEFSAYMWAQTLQPGLQVGSHLALTDFTQRTQSELTYMALHHLDDSTINIVLCMMIMMIIMMMIIIIMISSSSIILTAVKSLKFPDISLLSDKCHSVQAHVS